VQLAGGTVNDGPLAITVNIYGQLPAQQALRRDKATIGDLIFITGTLGDAGLALAVARGDIPAAPHDRHWQYLESRLHRPEPRIAAGIALRDLASSAIDLSDGLVADLNHVLRASDVGAAIDVTRLPLSRAMMNTIDLNEARRLALSAGDDYELCFTIPPNKLARLNSVQAHLNCPIQQIGKIERDYGLRCFDEAGSWPVTKRGYQHFA
jgi:thiamine-monophosphate kinase